MRAINWMLDAIVTPALTDPYVIAGRQGQALAGAGADRADHPDVGASSAAAAVYLWTVYRATPGQMALGLFTVDTDGRALRRGHGRESAS